MKTISGFLAGVSGASPKFRQEIPENARINELNSRNPGGWKRPPG